MFPTIQLGPLSIATPGLILIAGLWISLEIAERRTHFHAVAPNLIFNLTLWSFLAGILGARFAFILQYPEPFLKNPISLLSLNPGLLDPLAGMAIGTGIFLVYIRRAKASIWNVLDALTPGVAFFFAVINLSQLAGGTGYGLPSNLPWSIHLWGADRHPTQIYLLLAAIGTFIIVWKAQEGNATSTPGLLFLKAVLLLSLAYLFLAGFIADGKILLAGVRRVQLIALAILATGMWGYVQHLKAVEE